MNRDQYIQMRRTGQYDFGWFYQYFLYNKDASKATVPFEIFLQAFNMYFQMNAQGVLEFLDKKLDVVKLEGKEGNLIQIY